MTKETPRHPMGVVVQRTGLTSHVLRAWERRYGAVMPGRTEGGQRLYSDADLVRLRLLRQATDGGRPIGTVASLSTAELATLVGEDTASTPGQAGSRHLEAALAAAERMDPMALRTELMHGVVQLSVREFVTDVAAPLLERVGEMWERGTLRPAQEHVVSTAVRQVLDWLLARYEAPSSAPLAVLGTPSGEDHEFGAMLAAVVAADSGWRVLYLGPSLPAEEIAMAADRVGASLVGLSMVAGSGRDAGGWRAAVERVRDLVPDGTLVLIGGRAATAVDVAGVRRVTDLGELWRMLALSGRSTPGMGVWS